MSLLVCVESIVVDFSSRWRWEHAGEVWRGTRALLHVCSFVVRPCLARPDDIHWFVLVIDHTGTSFLVTWALWANHNNPPNPVGKMKFEWFAGVPDHNADFHEVTPWVPIVSQPTNTYYTQLVTIIPGGDAKQGGQATLRVHYDVNGGKSPFPNYYQCINLFVTS